MDISQFINQPEQKSVESQARDAMEQAGLTPPETILVDGQFRRFGYKDSCYYVIFPDGVPSGCFGDWRTDTQINFSAKVSYSITPEMQAMQRKRILEAQQARELEKKRRQAEAADTVKSIWMQAGHASEEHPYLQKKQINPNGARIHSDGRLIIPVFSPDGKLTSIQYINSSGEKQYHPGARVDGCGFQVGAIDKDSQKIAIAEGYATACTIYEQVGIPTIAAMSANNLPKIAEQIRLDHPTSQIIICADNDVSGVGLAKAEQASAKTGASVVIPPKQGDDFNDMFLRGEDIKTIISGETNLRKKLQILSSDDIEDKYIAPDEIVQGLFVSSEVGVLYGASNSGKTFLSVELAHAISTGKDFLGLRVDQGDVLYIAAESPQSIKVRIQAINKHNDTRLKGIHIIQAPVNLYSKPEYTIDIINAVKEIEKETGRKIKMILCDTLARMTAGANENSGTDMGPVIEAFDLIAKQTKTATVIIHHSGKDTTKGARGWSGLYGAVDSEIEVKEENGSRFFTVTKQRQLGTKGEQHFFDLEVVEMGVDKWGKVSSTCVVVKAEAVKKEDLAEEKAKILDCCYHVGKLDEIDGMPFISSSALSRQLFDLGYSKSESGAKQAVKPSAKGYLCNKLIGYGVIKHHGSGYLILDTDMAMIINAGIKGI